MTDFQTLEQLILEHENLKGKIRPISDLKGQSDEFDKKYSLRRASLNQELIAKLLMVSEQKKYKKRNQYLRFISEFFPFENEEEYVALEQVFATILLQIRNTKEYLKNEDAGFSLYLMADIMFLYLPIKKYSSIFKVVIPGLIKDIEVINVDELDFELHALKLLKVN